MNTLRVKATTFAGGSVEKCVRDLTELAQRLGCWVECNVNGVDVLTPPDATPDVMWANYEKARERGATFVSYNVIPAGRLALKNQESDRG
jgi:hypothetical protein